MFGRYLDSPHYEEAAEEEGEPGDEDRSSSGDQAIDRGPGVGRVTAVPGWEGPGLHYTHQHRAADDDTEEPHQAQHHLHPPDLAVNLPVLGDCTEMLSERHGSVDDEDHERHGVDHGEELHKEGVTLTDDPTHPPGLSEEVGGAEADVEDGLQEATDSQLEEENVVRHPPQGEGGPHRGDEDDIGGEGDEEYKKEKESRDDLGRESVGGRGRGPGHGDQGPVVQEQESDDVLLLGHHPLTPTHQHQQPQRHDPHPLTGPLLLTANTRRAVVMGT